MSALLWKEFRETVRWFPLCLLLMIAMIWSTIPGLNGIYLVSRLSGNLATSVAIGAIVTSIALAIAQFALDQRDSARGFLLHRRLSGKQIFHAKIVVGAALYVLAVGVPLILAAIYLKWIGPERLPTSWLQTVPAFTLSFYCFSFYFGTSIVLCRPARWIGTRLLPIAASALIAISAIGAYVPNTLIGTLVFLIGLIGYFILVFAARNAFMDGERSISPTANCKAPLYTKAILFTSAIVIAIAAIIAPSSYFGPSEFFYLRPGFDLAGEPWLVRYHYFTGMNPRLTARSKMVEEKSRRSVEEAPADWKFDREYFYFFKLTDQIENAWDPFQLSQIRNHAMFFDGLGHLRSFEFSNDRKGILRSNIIDEDTDDVPSKRRNMQFAKLRSRQLFEATPGLAIFVDSHGVYAINPKDNKCHTLLVRSIDGSANSNFEGKRLALAYQGSVSVYRLESSDETPAGIKLILDSTLEAEIPRSPRLTEQLSYRASDDWTWIAQISTKEYQVAVKRPADGKSTSFTYEVPSELIPENTEKWTVGLAVPLVYAVCVFAAFRLFKMLAPGMSLEQWDPMLESLSSGAIVMIVVAFLAGLITYAATRVRGLSRRERIVWSLIGFWCGIGTAIAVLAIYPRVYLDRCTRCDRKRRVERQLCEHCGAEWEPPVSEGVEIIDRIDSTVARHSDEASSVGA